MSRRSSRNKVRPIPGLLRELSGLDQTIFELAPIGMVLTGLDGTILEPNQSFCDLLGYDLDELRGMSITEITHPEDVEENTALNQKIITGEIEHFEFQKRYLARGGRIVYAILKAGLIRDQNEKPINFLAQVVDVTDRILAEGRLRHAAEHDAITGLPNRPTFMARLVELHEEGTDHSVLYMDLDEFKIVNDSLGHLAGDQLLVAIGRRLQSVVDSVHLIARHGGDDFTLLLCGVGDADAAHGVADLIHECLRAPFKIGEREVFTSASIGIAIGSKDYVRIEEILRDADTALYHAKRQGRGRTRVFSEEMRTEVLARLELETDMRRAIQHEEFRVFYQPIIRFPQGKVVGFEALLRWQHPRRGLLSPAAFLDLAEESGHIVGIGQWGLKRVCQTIKEWERAGTPAFVTVNLSHRQFVHPDLARLIGEALDAYDVLPSQLHLEITETVIMDYGPVDIDRLNAFRQMGLRLNVDDFGTGHSSLAHLHRLPIDALKIDRSFVERVGPHGENLDIIRTIITLAHNLGLEVIAEGVEQRYQRDYLQALGCEFGQGFFFAQPMPGHEATKLLQE